MSTRCVDRLPSCPDDTTLQLLLREELSPETTEILEAHVGACQACQGKLERLVGSLPRIVLGVESISPGQADSEDEEPPSLPGYALVGRIDAGGMGVVWRVRDLQFRRDLAVKVMKARACPDAALVERFVEEAQICGQLPHPFIVPVHAMGRLPDGRPYYTMKLVEGQTLAALLEGRPAAEHTRMELVQIFAEVCQAVAFAHRKGVVHRDLKPQNVMVGAHGEVQLMDWGLAKVLADPGSPAVVATRGTDSGAVETLTEVAGGTRPGSVLGTVAYMPPEQARGLAARVDQQSDVFGLGAILCQILTGDPPYTGPDNEAVLRQASAADLTGARERLRGCGADPELTELAQRCLSPDKADRPADGGAVAAVVAAYRSKVQEQLQQERLQRERQQVEAAEERRRRKLWMGLAAVVMVAALLLTAGLVVVNHLRTQEQAAKGLAQQREQETRAVMDELSSTVIDGWLSRQPQLTPEQKDFLKKGLAYYEKFTRETGQTPQGRAALARAYQRVGAIDRQLSLLPEAEDALRRAVQLSEALAREVPTDATYQRDTARALQDLAAVFFDRGAHQKAAPLLVEAIRYQREAVRRDSGDVKDRANLAKQHFKLGILRTQLRQPDEAETSFQEALTILKDLTSAFPDAPDYRRDLGDVHRSRGILLLNQHKLDEADDSFRQAVTILNQLVADYPFVPEYKYRLALGYNSRCETLYQRGRLDQARDGQDKALPILKTLVADFASVPRYCQDLAAGFNNLAIVLEDLGQRPEAEAALRQAITLREKLVRDFPKILDYVAMLGSSYGNLGALIRDQGRADASLEWFDKAVHTLEPALAQAKQVGYVRYYLRSACFGRAKALDRLGRHARAVQDWDRAIVLDDGKSRLFFQSRRALSQGDPAAAVSVAGQQARAKGVSNSMLCDCARVCGLAAAAVKGHSELQEQYASQALALLRQAVAAGYRGGPPEELRTDEAFKLLRGRKEFEQIVERLEPKATVQGVGRK